MSSIGLPFPSEIDLSEQDIFLADLQLLWPLYTGGKIDAAQDIYAAKVDESEALHQMKKDKAFLNLVKIYYGVVMSKSLFQTRQEVQNALDIHYQHAKKLIAQGQIAKIELLNAQVKLDAAKIETTKAKHKLSIVSLSLHNMIKNSSQPSSNLFVSQNVKAKEYYEDETLQNYAGLSVLEAKSKQTLSLVEIKEAAWHPKVMGYANYNLYKDDSPMMSMAPTWVAGLTVKIDLLQRKDRLQEVQATKLLNSKVTNLIAQSKEDLKLLVEKTYNEMLLYSDEYNSLNSSLDLAKENYRLREIAFSEGLATSVEVVDAQMFLAGAKTKRLNAVYNYVQKISQLSVLSGDRELFFEIENISKVIK
jgi:outer membrane protein TolC